MRQIFKCLILLCFFAVSISCGSSGGGSDESDGGGIDLNVSSLGTKTELTYTFSIALAAPSATAATFTFDLVDAFDVPLYIQSNGVVSIAAQQFPRMVVRICDSSQTSSDCDATTADLGGLEKVDLVIDSCGNGREHSECGEQDPTIYTGFLEDDGALTVSAIAMRIRIFLVDQGDSPDGFEAEDTDEGFLPDLDRIVAKITTDAVSTGPLSAIGSPVLNKQVTAVSAGTVPSSMPEIAGYAYLATMVGSFNSDPLSLLD